MKILVVGAGVLGSLYAARLQESGQHVTVLARGNRLSELRERGIVLEDGRTGQRTVTRVNVSETLTPSDHFDLAVVLVRREQLEPVLPVLRSTSIPSILFMLNNASGPEPLIETLGPERVLLGFPGAGGQREEGVVRWRIVSGLIQPTTLGELNGQITPRLLEIIAIFKAAGFPTAVSNNMDAWLKTHAAVVSPVANAIYLADGDIYRLASTRDGLVLMVRAIRENLSVLRTSGIPITPSRYRLLDWIPEPFLVSALRLGLASEQAELVLARHANSARAEMRAIARDLRTLARRAMFPTPAADRLAGFIDPRTPTLQQGSHRIGLSWSGMAALLAVVSLSGLILLRLMRRRYPTQ